VKPVETTGSTSGEIYTCGTGGGEFSINQQRKSPCIDFKEEV
jgi:hypothetical protein